MPVLTRTIVLQKCAAYLLAHSLIQLRWGSELDCRSSCIPTPIREKNAREELHEKKMPRSKLRAAAVPQAYYTAILELCSNGLSAPLYQQTNLTSPKSSLGTTFLKPHTMRMMSSCCLPLSLTPRTLYGCQATGILSRRQADNQMRVHFRDLHYNLCTPRLPSISVFGTRMTFYE